MTAYWFEYAWLGGDKATPNVLVTVEGERITAVETDVPLPPVDSVQLHGLTLPALANTHSHAFQRVLRGRTHERRGSFWTWRQQMYAAAAALQPESYFDLARGVFAEMVEAGFGVVGEFHYVHHKADGSAHDRANAMGEAVAAAAAEAGIRLTLLDTLYLYGGFATDGSDPYQPLQPEQERFSDGSVWAWVERARALKMAIEDATVLVGGAIHSVRAVDPMAMRVAAEWSSEHQAPLHVHVAEQRQEVEECEDQFAWSPVELLRREEVLGPRTTLIHATHVSDDDRAAIAESGSSVCVCPTTERDLADGTAPARSLVDAGVSLSIGTDSHAFIDGFEEMRAIELDQRLLTLERGLHPSLELLEMGTRNGYRALGWPDGGRIEVGNLADFTTIDLESARTAGSQADSLLGAAVFAAAAEDVRTVVIGGRLMVENGRHTRIETAEALSAAIAAVAP